MPVYVDSANHKFQNMIMCHLFADTTEELLACADAIGLQKKWVQNLGTFKEHFDVSQSMKKKAIEYGAKEVTGRDYALLMQRKMSKCKS